MRAKGKTSRVLCVVSTCKYDAYLSLNKMFTIDTEDICVHSIIKKCNKNENRLVRLSYPDLKFQLTSTLISKTSPSTMGTVLSCLAVEMKMNQIRSVANRTWKTKCREEAYLKIEIIDFFQF